ncbi:AraC-type DNA-binding protein [Acetitomaculum ruminis DSM 5522]|uniref:AraC-type DNA-binding protein n=1 Tax=Acetitomaculum ruminis DSM 5522 TaxID=1120918 RepID=A0A1I0Y5E8_9FIRM|nr:AraC family transcriptional regulator [Acetitomaculum ruminis]SFB07668.1 AraC-type DNA-binding protein [Acetitomaculum ruminis DSM 5522]
MDYTDINSSYYKNKFENSGFIKCENTGEYPPCGDTFMLSSEIGQGYFWYYEVPGKYNIKIHDFRFNEDTVIDMKIPECLSITRYDSISGEELKPYRKLRSGLIKSFRGGYEPYHALIHKYIPIKSIGIEYHPNYYNKQLKSLFANLYQNPAEAFKSIDETTDFPEMMKLLWDIKNYRGDSLSAALYFEGKANEALSLVYNRHLLINSRKKATVSAADKEMLDALASYINDHYADNLTIDSLSKIGCMGTTKLKKCFRIYFDCTINEYIQNVRLDHAEHLLLYTELPVGEIAKAVGYQAAGHFAALFAKHTGVLPLEYRKSARK